METNAKTTKTTKKLLKKEDTTQKPKFNRTKYINAKLAYFVTSLRNDRVQYLYDNNKYTTMKKIKYNFTLQVVQNLKPATRKQLEDAMSLIMTIAEASNEDLQKVANRTKE